jgi:alkaline phosphatase D
LKYHLFIKLFLIQAIISSPVEANSIKLGLGSCLDQDFPQPIWNSIEKENLNYFIFLGDNVYGDSPDGKLDKLKYAYKKQESLLPNFLNDINVLSIWDDHDYGLNDGGGSYSLKKESQKMFLDFWEIPNNDMRSSREGIYFSQNKTFFNKKFKLIFLDTRYFRSPLVGPKGKYLKNISTDSTILGINQWDWLEKELDEYFDFLIIFSSIQIIPEDHGFEKWGNFPNDRNKFFSLLEKNVNKTLLVSGDRHLGGIYKKDGFIEITASSLNKPGSLFFETDKYLLGKTYRQENYGIIEIFENSIELKLKNKLGKTLNSLSINY